MKTLLQAFVLCGIASVSTSTFAQESCSKAEKAACSAKAELASTEAGECSGAASDAAAELASTTDGSACSQAAAAKQCGEKSAELASTTDGQCGSASAEHCKKADGALASAKDGSACSSADAKQCKKADGALATAKDGSACSSADAKQCKQADGALATAKDGSDCSSADAKACSSEVAKRVTPASAQLASLIQPGRVAGIVVDGKAYLGSKAICVVDGLVRAQVGTEIAAVCEESRACEKTLASNVDKTLAAGVCMKSQFSSLLASGAIDSLIIDDESSAGEAALASLTKITSCEKFKAECSERAGAAAPATTKVVEAKPAPMDAQLAALVQGKRIAGVVVDGKSYSGAEANAMLASMIRGNVEGTVKEKCEASRACEKTLAMNVDKALASKVCVGSQLASLLESGRVQGVVVKGETVNGAEAANVVKKIVSCPEFQAECQSLASAPASECSSAKEECSSAAKQECAEAKAECSSKPAL